MRFLSLTLAVSWWIVAAPAQATTVRQVSLPELVDRSELVIIAWPTARESFWEGGRIRTRVHVEVETVWRGRAAKAVDVVTLGGIVGDVAQHVEGAPVLQEGRRFVLFLRQDRLGRYETVGLSQGVFEIVATTGDPAIQQSGGEANVLGSAPTAMPRRLSELKNAVHGIERER